MNTEGTDLFNTIFPSMELFICLIVIACLAFISFVLVIIFIVLYCKLNKKYKAFMKGSDGKALEDSVIKRFAEIDKLKDDSTETITRLNTVCEQLKICYQKIGIIKYDAFSEMGGKLSFSLALLDDLNTGFVMSSMHTREGCYTYIKEIIQGESFVILSEEEKKALEQAKTHGSMTQDMV